MPFLDNSDIALIASRYAGRHDVTSDDVIALVRKLFAEVGPDSSTSTLDEVSAPARADAVMPVERSVTPNTIYCLCCGKGFKMLKRHLNAAHGMSEDDYRHAYGLPHDMPLVAPDYSAAKAEYAKKVGLGTYARPDTDKAREVS